jgi:hypothetical protein
MVRYRRQHGAEGDFSMSRRLAVLFMMIFLAFQAQIEAQVITASLQGAVHDTTGAVVPGAKVKVVNTDTNAGTNVITGPDGRFIAPALTPGPYSLTVQAAGFKQFEQVGIHLQVTQAAKIDVLLEVGAISESIKVTGEAPLLEATTSSMGQVIESGSIVNLPLNQRNPFSLVFLVPGVHGSVGSTFNSDDIAANGGRSGSNDILLDGVPSSPPVVNPIQGFSIFPSVDAVQEFKMQTNNYSAEFGRSGGTIVNLIYKSGTNDVHGSTFEFLRNSMMDANNFYSNSRGVPLTSYKRNQFGASIGGPVYLPHLYNGHNRTFFFFAYEGLRERTAANPMTTSVPTDLQKTGDFSQTLNGSGQPVILYDPVTTTRQANGSFTRQAFPGNVIPSARIDPVARNVVKYFPEPNGAGNAFTHANNFFSPGTNPNGTNQVDAKIDQIISNNQRFFVRASRRKLQLGLVDYFPSDDLIAQGGNTQHQDSIGTAVDYTLSVSPTYLMEFRAGFSRMALNFLPRSIGYNPTQLGLPGYLSGYGDIAQMPQFAPAAYAGLGNGSFDFRHNAFESYIVMWSNTKVMNRHVLKFGFETRVLRVADDETNQPDGSFSFAKDMTQGPNPTAASNVAGDGLASMLIGLGSGGITKNYKNVATQSQYYGGYFADDLKVSSRLTFNLGLRYEVEAPRTERHDRATIFDPNVTSPLGAMVGMPNLKGGLVYVGVNGHSRQQFPADKNNFAPRFGFAYQASKRMVFRGAFGIFYAPTLMQAGGNTGNYGYSADTSYVGSVDGVTPNDYLSNPFPKGFTPIVGNSQGLLTAIGTSINPTIGPSPNPYSMNWNYGIQYQLPGGILLEPSYVGSRGLKLTESVGTDYNLNQLSPDQLALGNALLTPVKNPFYGVITTGALSSATVPQSVLLRRFPQYTVVGDAWRIGARSIYHSFQLKAEKRFSHGVTFLVAYTNGKLMDDHSAISNVGADSFRQNIYDRKNDWSVSANDVSQRLAVSYVWELPFGKGRLIGKGWIRPIDYVLGGWQMNGILSLEKGLPLTMVASNPSQSGNGTERPNNNGHSGKLGGSIKSRLTRYFDTTAFSTPLPFTFGNLGRTVPDIRGPGTQNLDYSLFKNFKFKEKYSVQLRGEFFNATNTVRFGSPNLSASSNVFGQISSQANSPRQTQVGLKFLF